MRRPNFLGWVSRELRYLSGQNTLNLRKLAYMAQGENPRLRERLALYAIAAGKLEKLVGYLYDDNYANEIIQVGKSLGKADYNTVSASGLSTLPGRYAKAINAYQSAYHRIDARNESKHMRREKTILLQKKKGISNSEIYHCLGLDAGNVNAYLKNGDIDRISLSTATDIMNFVLTA